MSFNNKPLNGEEFLNQKIGRRDFCKTLGVATLGAVALGSTACAQQLMQTPGRKRPNIIYIMSDDHSAHAISAYGSKINKTPNIDRLGRDGARMNNCFCTNSICTPSRAAIMTGQYSQVNGVRGWDDFDSSRPIQIQKILRDNGYTTGFVGKWHLGRGAGSNPQGFDYWEAMPGQGRYDDPIFYNATEEKVYPGYSTTVTTDLALNWLNNGRDKSKPFYLVVHQKAPHRNWIPEEKYKKMFEGEHIPQPETFEDDYATRPAAAAAHMRVGRDMTLTDTKGAKPPEGLTKEERDDWYYQVYIKDYLRCVQSVDDSVGQLLDWLDQNGLAQDTIIVYTSDQGFYLGEHGWFDKRFFYEESLRMPFMIRYPRAIPAGQVKDEFLLNVDFAPTLLDYAGLKVPDQMQGHSADAMLGGKTPADWQTSMYYRYWVNGDEHNTAAHYGVRTPTHKLIYYYCDPLDVRGATPLNPPVAPYWELFDLKKDPHELHNVYGDPANAALIKGLKVELARLQAKLGDKPQPQV